MRVPKPYNFAGETTSLCEVCLALVPAKVIFQDNKVYYLKRCRIHGEQRTLISTDISYYLRSGVPLPTFPPRAYGHPIEKGCPFDCGLCEDHEQHSAATIIEVTDDCDMSCSTCIASSYPGAGNIKAFHAIESAIDTAIAGEGELDILMISGGEPTTHPQISDILRMACSKAVRHVMLITNGRRIAADKSFVGELGRLGPGFEVYLQFDSLRKEALVNIRGADLRDIREGALFNLDASGISTTLVCVVKKGVNDDEPGAIIDYAIDVDCIRGVTFQPIKATGRHDGFVYHNDAVMLSDVRRAILRTSNLFSERDLIPHPCNPQNICVGYLDKSSSGVTPASEYLFGDEFPGKSELGSMLFFLPDLNTEVAKYERLFRVAIISFLDRFNFSLSSIKRSCINIVSAQGAIIPLDAYYLFYSGKDQPTLSLPILRED